MRFRSLIALCAVAALPLSACSATESNTASDDSGAKGDGPISVASSDDKCEVSATEIGSGNLVFKIRNTGTHVTEFYLYGEDGLRIVGEVENVGPGLTRDLVVRATPGKYVTSCRPGMTGKGIRNAFTVTDSGSDSGGDSGRDDKIAGVDQAEIDRATTQYAAYIKDQSSQLVEATTRFLAAYEAGDDAKARKLFPLARVHWERIETVAESFGDLDPRMDLREADLEPAQKWTGWHRIEKDLWPPATGYTKLTPAERKTVAVDLLTNTKTLDTRVQTLEYTVDQIGNGSKGLLDEVATGKITGEEDIWSHTDLYDFQANVDGARVGYEGLQPLLEVKDPELSKEIGVRFTALQKLLEKYRVGEEDFVFYDKVTDPQRKELSDAVNALSEKVAAITGAITL